MWIDRITIAVVLAVLAICWGDAMFTHRASSDIFVLVATLFALGFLQARAESSDLQKNVTWGINESFRRISDNDRRIQELEKREHDSDDWWKRDDT